MDIENIKNIENIINIDNIPESIAIIMDGNRRWAREKGLQDVEGHKSGAENIKRIAKFANKLGIKYMTVYAFSTENWKRSKTEVSALMFLFKKYLEDLLDIDTDVKVRVIGRRKELSKELLKAIKNAEEKTKNNTGMTLNVAINYGGRDEITTAARKVAEMYKNNEISLDDITEELMSDNMFTGGQADPDVLIRTSGELRTSNFLPWQITYSEFIFAETYWPAFDEMCLLDAIKQYQLRTRKFGGNK